MKLKLHTAFPPSAAASLPLACALAFGMIQSVHAVDRTWIGAQDGAYNTTTNWSPNGTMVAGDTAVFDGSAPGSPDQNATLNINKMLFKSTAGKAYTPGFGNWNVNVAGAFIEVESGNIYNNIVNPDRGSGPAITLKNGDNTILNNGGGTLTISSGSTFNGNAIRANGSGASTLIVDGSGSTIIGTASNPFFKLADNSSNVLSLTKNGGGTLTLDTLNTFTGQTLINDGVLRVLNGGALGSSTETRVSGGSTADGRLELSGGITVASETLRIDGRQNAAANIASLSNLSGNNEWQGSIIVSTGGGNYNIESQAGNLKLSGTLDMGSLNRTWQLMGAGDGEISGAINDGSTGVKVTKLGAGTWTLSNTSTYTGATLVSAGTLLVNGALGSTAVTVDPTATVGGTGSLGGSLAFAGTSNLQVVDFNDPLAVAGTVTFGSGFGIDNLLGINWDSLDLNTAYTVLSTTQIFGTGDIANFGFANRVAVGSLGREAYFQNGSLQVVVILEPSAALLGGLGVLALLRRRRA